MVRDDRSLDLGATTAGAALLVLLSSAHIVVAQTPRQGPGPARNAIQEVVSRGDVNCLHQDDHGFVWFCTADGLERFDGRSGLEFARQPGLRAFARTYDGRLWVGGSSGLFELWRDAPAGTNPLVRIPADVVVNALYALPSGALAVATDTGVMQITARALTPLVMNGSTLKGIAEPVRVIFNITPHRFAAGTSNGVYLLLGDGRTTHLTTADGLPDNQIEAFTQGIGADRRLWVGTKRGIAIVDWDRIENGLGNVVSTLPGSDPMSGAEIRALQARGNSLWIATPAGLFVRDSFRVDRARYDPVDVRGVVRRVAGYAGDTFVSTDTGVHALNVRAAPPDVAITSVKVDGVVKFRRPQGSKQVRVDLSRATQLVEIEFVSPRTEYLMQSMRQTLLGSIAYQVKAGRLERPDDVFSDLPPQEPSSHFEEVSSKTGPAPVRGDVFVPLPRPFNQLWLKPPVQEEPFGPVIVRRTLDDGPPTVFASRHAVTADETGWLTLPTGIPNRVVIEHPSQTLDAGLYRLVVYAGPRYRATGGDSAVVLFTVVAPLWVRWWFVAPLAVALVAALFVVRWQRERTRRSVSRLRASIAADLHDSVGASLSRIALLSDVVQQQVSGQMPAAAESLHAIGNSARSVIDEMNDAVWFIDSEVRDIRQMLVRVRTVAAMLFEADGIRWTVEASDDALDIPLASEQRRHLFLLIKEALTNARRHAQPVSVSVRVARTTHGLQVAIEDDGPSPAGRMGNGTDGNGVRNMHRRASELGGTLTIEERQPPPGTRVVLQAPLR